MPNKELLQKWVDVLENPASRQTRMALSNKQTGGKCCLGHLAPIVGVELFDGEGDDRHKQFCIGDGPTSFQGKSYDYLPREAWEKLGIDEAQGVFASMNDIREMSLAEIASYIRVTYLMEKKDADDTE